MLKIYFLSMIPIGELRFSIPYGIIKTDYNHLIIIVISILGNLTIAMFLTYFIPFIIKIIDRIKIFNKLLECVLKRTMIKGKIIDKMKYYGIILFVGIPLPITGVWTATLAAYLFGLSKRKTILAIIFGLLISASIVSILTLTGVHTFNVYNNF